MPSKEKFSSPVRLLKPAEHDQHRTESGFVGREREIAELRAALDDTHSGRGRLFLISGEPGIGKTRLADELAGDAASRGMRVVWGRCWEGGGAPAYLPWVDVLRALILNEARERVRHSALPAEIAQLIPELSSETTMPRVSADPAQARFRLFEAIATLLKQTASSAPLLIVLDDLHEADHGSLELLKFVARGLTDSRIVIVGTHRDAEVRRSPHLSEAIGEILRHGHAIPLAGLDQNEVMRIVEDRAQRSPSAAFASELYRVTAGNPLFVDGVIRVLLAERNLGTSDRIDLRGFKLPEDVRGAIRKRLGLLSAPAQSVLAMAAVVGQEFHTSLLQRVGNVSAGSIGELMNEASDMGLVARSSHDSYRFTHPLIRESLYKGSTDAERMRLHRAIGEALEQMHAANLTPHLAELAHHFREARIVEKAIAYSIRAGDEARRIFAHEDAGSHWSTALELLEESGGDRHLHADLHHRLGELMGGQGERARRLEHLEEALRIYEELGDADGAAQLHLSLGNNLSIVGLARAQDLPRAADHLRRAEAVLSKGPENPDLVKLYFFIGSVAAQSCRVRDAVVAFRHSMEIAERIGHSEFWAMSAGSLTWILPQTGKIGEALEVQAQVWSKLDTLNTPGFASATVAWSGYCLMQLWDPRGAQKWWGTELAKSRLGRGQRKVFMRVLQDAYLLSGDLPAARSLLEQEPHASAAGMLAFYEGDWDRADSILEQGLERARSGMPSEMFLYGQALARVRWNRGEPTRAETLLREALAPYPDEDPHCQVEMVVRPELALVYLEMRQQEDAVAQVSRCREVSAGEDWRGLGGHLARADAAVAAAEGKLDAALAGFESAVTIFRKYALPWEEADTLHRWGRALSAAGAPDRANQKFDVAIQLYQCHGAGQRWVDEVEADRNTGVRRSSVTSDNGTFPPIFRKEGEYWKTAYEGGSANVRERGGMRFIALLLARPGEDIPAIEMFAAISASAGISSAQDGLRAASDLGDAGEEFDARALSEYRRRVAEVESEIEAAEASHDSGAAARARAEREMLSQEIASGTGLHGGLRRAASHRERARVNVTRQIKSAIDAVRKVNPALGRHLANCISTGSTCRYAPADRIKWQL